MAKVNEISFDAQMNEELGEIKITTGVLESIAVQTTSDIEGVVTEASGFQKEVGSFLGMERDRINAAITSVEDQIVIDIEIRVLYGYSVPEVAMQIQEKVKEQILFMTDLVVSEVNVHVLAIETEASKAELYHLETEEVLETNLQLPEEAELDEATNDDEVLSE